MRKWMDRVLAIFLLFILASCAGTQRSCTSACASEFGADWIVVELREYDGTPYRCWMLEDVSIENEEASDGIYWLTAEGNLVHVSGSYDRVQVDADWDAAFAEINMTREACEDVRNSRYDPDARDYLLLTSLPRESKRE